RFVIHSIVVTQVRANCRSRFTSWFDRSVLVLVALLSAAVAMAVGADDCSGCHAVIARSYSTTGMARSFGQAGADVPSGSIRHAASAQIYSVFRRDRRSIA